jgi:hypothetical protein
MRITITAEEIEKGRVRDAQNCPVALALRRAGVSHFGVSGILVWLAAGNRAVVLPVHIQEWILSYDYGCLMSPIEFDLDLSGEESKEAVKRPQESARKMRIPLIAQRNPSPEPVRISCRNGYRAPGISHARRRSPRRLEPVGV